MELMNREQKAKLNAYLKEMPPTWRPVWDNYSDMKVENLLRLAHEVVESAEQGQLTYQQAGAILSPFAGHPASTSWSDGEFVAIGLFADDIAQGPLLTKAEQVYLWSELRACLRRLESAESAA